MNIGKGIEQDRLEEEKNRRREDRWIELKIDWEDEERDGRREEEKRRTEEEKEEYSIIYNSICIIIVI